MRCGLVVLAEVSWGDSPIIMRRDRDERRSVRSGPRRFERAFFLFRLSVPTNHPACATSAVSTTTPRFTPRRIGARWILPAVANDEFRRGGR